MNSLKNKIWGISHSRIACSKTYRFIWNNLSILDPVSMFIIDRLFRTRNQIKNILYEQLKK
jgi:hypothetical protein